MTAPQPSADPVASPGDRSEPTRPERDRDSDSPWAGIPAELLDGAHCYDPDTPGGCG